MPLHFCFGVIAFLRLSSEPVVYCLEGNNYLCSFVKLDHYPQLISHGKNIKDNIPHGTFYYEKPIPSIPLFAFSIHPLTMSRLSLASNRTPPGKVLLFYSVCRVTRPGAKITRTC